MSSYKLVYRNPPVGITLDLNLREVHVLKSFLGGSTDEDMINLMKRSENYVPSDDPEADTKTLYGIFLTLKDASKEAYYG